VVRILDLKVGQSQFDVADVRPQSHILQAVGGAIEAAGKMRMQSEKREGEAFLNTSLYEMQTRQAENFNKLQLEHEDINTFTDKYREQIEDDIASIKDSAPSYLSSVDLDNRLNRAKASLLNKAVQYQAGEKVRLYNDSMSKAGNDIVKGALITGDYDAAKQQLGELIENSQNLTTPAQLKKMHTDLQRSLTMTEIKATINDDPSDVEAVLEKHQKALEPNDILALRREAEGEVKRREAEYEKNLIKRQDKARFEFIANPEMAIPEAIKAAVRNNTLDPDDGEALLKMRSSGGGVSKDNLSAIVDLNQRFANGDLTAQDVLLASSRGEITHSTAKSFIEKTTSKISTSPAYKQGLKLLDAEVEEISLGVRMPEDEKKLAEATLEYDDRIKAGENPRAVARELAEEMRSSKAEQLKNSRRVREYKREFGIDSLSEWQERKDDLTAAFNAGRITQQQFVEEFKTLELLKGRLK